MTEQEIIDVRESILKVEEEIGKGIIGQKEVIRHVIVAMMCGGNVLLEGVPGLGKTQLVKTIAKAMDLDFSRIQFTPDLMPADVTGTTLIVSENGNNSFSFEKGPVFTNLLLADEINRATPKTQSALLEAMQEHTVTAGRETYSLPKPFLVLATQNPIENEGTYPLPEAQLDRFFFKVLVAFPSKEELKQIATLTTGVSETVIDTVMNGELMIKAGEVIRNIPMSGSVLDYAAALVSATHPEDEASPESARKYISCGASPRALQTIVLASKAFAYLDGRMNVSFDDVRRCAPAALRHRLILNYEAISEGLDADEVIRRVTDEVTE